MTKSHERSLRALAARLGKDRTLVQRRMSEPGAPARTSRGYLVSAAAAYLDAADPQFQTLRAERWRIENRRKEIKLGVESGEFVSRAEVIVAVKSLTSNLRQAMRRVFTQELPVSLQGLDVISMQEKLREACDRLVGMINARPSPWTVPDSTIVESPIGDKSH